MNFSMEFALYHKQIEELQEKIEKIRVEYSKKTEKSLEIQNEEINKHERKSALKKQEESLKSKLGRLQGEKGILAAEVSSWKAKLREINTKIKELNSQKGRDGGKVSQDLDQKLKEIRDELGKLRVAKQQSEKEVLELKSNHFAFVLIPYHNIINRVAYSKRHQSIRRRIKRHADRSQSAARKRKEGAGACKTVRSSSKTGGRI